MADSINIFGDGDSYFTYLNGDFWITKNAMYSEESEAWLRIDTSKWAAALQLLTVNNLPYEPNTKGIVFWRVPPGSNPISNTFGATNGWQNTFLMTEFGDLVVGGYGIELDGNGTFPYGRIVNYSSGNTSPKMRGFLTNTFTGFSGVDSNTDPSWFIGNKDDSFLVGRASAGNFTPASFASLLSINASGTITLAHALPISSGGTGATTLTAPTVTKFTSGSGTYTLPTNPSPLYIEVVMVGGGGGGAGGGTTMGSGGAGGNTTFGTSLLVANGGTGGQNTGAGGTGGSSSLGSGPVGEALTGSQGVGFYYTGTYVNGGAGGNSPFGGAGIGYASTAGSAANTNSGSGGGGGGGYPSGVVYGGAGGASGGYIKAVISNPSASYSYSVGTGGSGGSAGTNGCIGGAGGSGVIYVWEYYL